MRWSRFDDGAQRVLLDARRRALSTGSESIRSAHLLAACLVDPAVREMLNGVDIDPGAVSTLLGQQPAPQRSDLLASLGIDVASVARALPTEVAAVPWRLRRWATRPLRITLEATSSTIRYATSGRKVLEVALWHAKRGKRTASSVDVLRGIVADGRDPINACLVRDRRAGDRLYEHLFGPKRSRLSLLFR